MWYTFKVRYSRQKGCDEMYHINKLFDLTHTRSAEYLQGFQNPWQALPGLGAYIEALGQTLSPEEFIQISPKVWMHKSATIAPTAYLGAPCIIGAETEVRHGAFIRGCALIGDGCVVGNSVELKNVILFDEVQVPHFNYVGDSILGYKAHMGAGSITSNVKSDRSNVVIHAEHEIPTGMRKLGAMMGDFVEIGCNSVLNPGCILGRHSSVYPLCSVRGVIPENSIVKSCNIIVQKEV